jgi:hypothetical protein
MKPEELHKMLSGLFPTCHYDWSGSGRVPEPPYVAWLDESDSNFGADNTVYYSVPNYTVELYVRKDNLTSEKAIEELFDSHKIYYEKHKIWIKDIRLFQINYLI